MRSLVILLVIVGLAAGIAYFAGAFGGSDSSDQAEQNKKPQSVRVEEKYGVTSDLP